MVNHTRVLPMWKGPADELVWNPGVYRAVVNLGSWMQLNYSGAAETPGLATDWLTECHVILVTHSNKVFQGKKGVKVGGRVTVDNGTPIPLPTCNKVS